MMYRYSNIVLFLVTAFVVIFSAGAGVIENLDVTEYDYIVVGVGHSGSVVAGRLGLSKYSVLAVETGGLTHRSIGGKDWALSKLGYDKKGNVIVELPYTRFDVPSLFSTYAYAPTPYPPWYIYYNGALTNSASWAAKNVGGGGLHALIWVRVLEHEANEWGKIARGWSYADVLPFYKKSENATGSPVAFNVPYHGYSGPIQLAGTDIGDLSVPLYVQTCVNLGLPNNTDFNGASRFGCGLHTTNRIRGIRDSAANAYLPKVLNRPNFHLLIHGQVTKILFKNDGHSLPRAYAVELYKNGVKYTVQARKEIILTLGTLHTPKLLLLSGIGPAADLKRLGIPVVYDSPHVGKHLHNNQACFGTYEYPGANYPNGWQAATAVTEYAFNGTGPFAADGVLAWTYWNTKNGSAEPNYGTGLSVGNVLSSSSNLQVKVVQPQFAPVNPKMRGEVTLHSADPFDPPNVTIDLWKYQEDVDVTIAAIRLMRKILSSPPVNSVMGAEISPGPSYVTDKQLTTWIKATGEIVGHWSSTARIGNDPATSVLDPQLRVRGVTGLRVGDTSVVPFYGYHIQATAVMLGERAAAFVLEDSENFST